MDIDNRVNEICREFDERAKVVGVTLARLELAEALARAEQIQQVQQQPPKIVKIDGEDMVIL